MRFDGNILINEDKIKWKKKESIMKKTRLSGRKKESIMKETRLSANKRINYGEKHN